MIDTSPSSVRVLAIMILSVVWLYLVVESFAINSVKKDENKNRRD